MITLSFFAAMVFSYRIYLGFYDALRRKRGLAPLRASEIR
jgi:hypothetical protein